MSQKRRSKQKTKQQPEKVSSINKWLPIAAFIAVGIIIFYPPYFRGLFFPEDMFVYHIFTALAFIVVWADKIQRKDYTFIQTPLDWAVLAYAAAYLLSLLGAVHPGEAYYGFLKALNFFMVYWMVTQVVKDYRAYENILRILLAAGVGVAAIGILAATGYSHYPSAFDGKQIMSTLQYTNATAAYLAVLSLIGVTLWIREKNLVMKFVYGISTYLMMLVVIGAVSKGAWLIFIAGALLLLIGMPGIYRIKSIYNLGIAMLAAIITASSFIPAITGENQAGGLPLVLIGMLIILVGQGIWEGIIHLKNKQILSTRVMVISIVIIGLLAGGILVKSIPHKLMPENIASELTTLSDLQNSSFTSRAAFYSWGLAIVKDHPVVGTGAGGWNALYHQYQDYLTYTTEAHNHFIQVWVEAGTIGFLAFISMWVLLLIIVYRIYQIRKREDNKSDKKTDHWVLIWGTASTALAFGLHASIDFDLSLAALALLLWVLFALINSGLKLENLSYKNVQLKAGINIAMATALAFLILFTGSSYTAAHNACQKADKSIHEFAEAKDGNQQNDKLIIAEQNYVKAVTLDSHSAAYHADLAQIYAIRFNQLRNTNQAVASDYYQKTIKEIEVAEKLSPYDIRIRNSLLNTCSKTGNIEGVVRQAEQSLKASPNDINAYNGLAKVLWMGTDNYLHAGKNKEAGSLAEKLVTVDEKITAQKKKTNPDKPWQGKPLALNIESRYDIARANYLTGNYKESILQLKPWSENLLALEFSDSEFENTEFENQNWSAKVVADSEAEDGKCVEFVAKQDMHDWPTVLSLAGSIPINSGAEYLLEARYKIIACGNSLDGEQGPSIGIWGITSGNNESKNTSFGLYKGEKSSTEQSIWQIAKQALTHDPGMQKRNFRIGTGSVKKGTTFRIDYIKFCPADLNKLPENVKEARVWYAASLYKSGQKHAATQTTEPFKTDTKYVNLYNQLINQKPLK